MTCPFYPSVASFWAEWWLSNRENNIKDKQDSSVVSVSQKVIAFFLHSKQVLVQKKKAQHWDCKGPLMQLEAQLIPDLFTVHYIWILCRVHWSSVPMGHHESHKQRVVRNGRHWYPMYPSSNMCLSFLQDSLEKAQVQREKCIKISNTAKITKLYTIVLIGICPTSQNQSCSIIRSYGKLAITSESATYLLWIALAVLHDPLMTT